MAKLTLDQLLKNKKVLPASELKAQKEMDAAAQKVFDDAVVEQTRNQRFQAPKEVGSITRPYKRESLED
ncbi:hypothetical protein DP176_07055 [Polynucleobacter paneuropaeus]|uniref:Uncharacterized protein n=1 Tax=Polynucleobacter paneuropaeus TaxID=2527775 RepID=A0ABX9FDA2_9BURK|nr:hypothetical protein [Polynucleobacter paneuropaeus]RAZ42299.1 hypothetical protein DP176_07055 [Polynucleobacter paneuropaeus]